MLTFLIAGNNCFADQAINLGLGDKAPFAGVLLPQSLADSMKLSLINADYNKALSDSLQKSVDLYKANEVLYQNKITLYSDQNDKLASRVSSEQTTSDWTKGLYFVLGVLATCAAGYSVSHLK